MSDIPDLETALANAEYREDELTYVMRTSATPPPIVVDFPRAGRVEFSVSALAIDEWYAVTASIDAGGAALTAVPLNRELQTVVVVAPREPEVP